MSLDPNKDDEVIVVSLPLKDYKIMREIINERKAMDGIKLWFTSRVMWIVGGILSFVGLVEAFRRFGD